MKRVMALATRLECDEESNGFGGKSDGNEGGRQLMATRAMATVTADMVDGDGDMVLPLVSCWWWSCCFCLAKNATTNHHQALQRRTAAGNESATA